MDRITKQKNLQIFELLKILKFANHPTYDTQITQHDTTDNSTQNEVSLDKILNSNPITHTSKFNPLKTTAAIETSRKTRAPTATANFPRKSVQRAKAAIRETGDNAPSTTVARQMRGRVGDRRSADAISRLASPAGFSRIFPSGKVFPRLRERVRGERVPLAYWSAPGSRQARRLGRAHFPLFI